MLNLASQNFIVPIFPSSKLLLKKSSREVIRIAKFANEKKSANDTFDDAFTGLFSVCASAKDIAF